VVKVIPMSWTRLLYVPPIAAIGLLVVGVLQGGAIGMLSGLFLVFFLIPGLVIFRHLDTRAWVEVEEITLDKGTATHRQYAIQIKEAKTYDAPGSGGRTFEPGDLYRDALKRRKWIYYFLRGFRARCVLVYNGEEKTPVKYVAPAVPGDILFIAYTTATLKAGLGKIWSPKTPINTLIIIAVLVIVALLAVSWFQSSGVSLGGF